MRNNSTKNQAGRVLISCLTLGAFVLCGWNVLTALAQCNGGTKPSNISITRVDPDTITAGSSSRRITVKFKLSGAGASLEEDPTTVTANWGNVATLPVESVSDLGNSEYSARFFISGALLKQPHEVMMYIDVNYCTGGTISSTAAPIQVGYFYYFAHVAAAQIWRTTFTYVNPSEQSVTCDTDFYSNSGAPLLLSFAGTKMSTRNDTIEPGGTLRVQTDAEPDSPVLTGWARSVCNGSIKASLLFRSYDKTVTIPRAEGSVIAITAPSSSFVTFADQNTGIAYANPAAETATINFIAKDTNGATVQVWTGVLPQKSHGSFNLRDIAGVPDFTGSLTISSSIPFISLSLNFESAPLFSALPPGHVDFNVGLKNYFAHIAAAQIWRTTFTYVNPTLEPVVCDTYFYSNSGQPLLLSFGGSRMGSRTDMIPPGGTLHVQTAAEPDLPLATGWARCDCNGPVKASALFRSYDKTVTLPRAEGGVIAMTTPATKFVTFSDEITGVAYANPSTATAEIAFTAKDAGGGVIKTWTKSLPGGHHASFNVREEDVPDFTGSLTIVSSIPIISLSLNFESAPLFSALPPGEDVLQ